MKKKRYLIQYSIRYFAIVSSIAATAFFCANQKCPADDEFKPIVVIKKKFPAIKAGEAKSLADADQILLDEELVIGVEINGQSRAYPINMMTGPSREIINDTLGGTAIAATW